MSAWTRGHNGPSRKCLHWAQRLDPPSDSLLAVRVPLETSKRLPEGDETPCARRRGFFLVVWFLFLVLVAVIFVRSGKHRLVGSKMKAFLQSYGAEES